MRMQCGLARGAAVAVLLVCAASTAPAQLLPESRDAGNRPAFDVVALAKAIDDLADPHRSAFNAPLPPPPQLGRRKAIVLGIVIGGVVGATAGYLIGRDSCTSCDDSGPVLVASSLGAVAGAALGGFVAAQNSPPDLARSSLRRDVARQVPHPVVRYQVVVFR